VPVAIGIPAIHSFFETASFFKNLNDFFLTFIVAKLQAMTEATLRELPLEILIDMMIKSTKELLDAIERNEEDGIDIIVKKKQLQMIQAAILAKKTELKETN